MMQVFNTLTNKKEEFRTMEPNKVRMYVCGPTVYNFIHIGNARPICVFDVFRRFLTYRGYDVTFVQNYTDVNDKIIKQSKQENLTPEETAEKYIHEYETDAKGLNVLPATVHPKVSLYIDKIIDFIQKLIDNGFAYQAEGDVYYRTRKFTGYGKWTSTTSRRIRWTSHSGRAAAPTNSTGIPRGVRDVRAGTSSAPAWQRTPSAIRSTSTAAARI